MRAAHLLLLVLLAGASAHAAEKNDTRAPPTSALIEQAERRVITLTNDLRVKNALTPLDSEGRLTETARVYAAHLASTGKLDHEADGATPAERVKKRGYSYCMVAENLASEYSSAGFTADTLSRNVVEGWSGSPTHRANMLQADLTQIGVGIARSAIDGEYFAVQVFGRPLAQMVKFSVSNRSNSAVRYEYRNQSLTLAPKQMRSHQSCVASELKLSEKSGAGVSVRPQDSGRYVVGDGAGGTQRLLDESSGAGVKPAAQ